MGTCVGSVSHGCLAAVLVVMFIILLVVVHTTIRKRFSFGDAADWVVAFCVALLSIIGLVRFLGSSGAVIAPAGEPKGAGGVLDVVLLPYAALAGTILLMLFLLAVGRVLHGREPWRLLEPAKNCRTSTERGVREGDHRRRETKSYDSGGEKHVMVWKNGEMMKKGDG